MSGDSRTSLAARRRSNVAVVAIVGLAVVACTKHRGEAVKTPSGVGSAAAAAAPSGTPVIPGGPQFGINDQPSGGDAAKRPQMSARAAEAYAAGMQAFQAGDLETARGRFLAASEADPRAYQAFYSLGVVRERLGDSAGARTSYRKALNVVPDYEPAIVSLAVLTARTASADEAESFLRGCQTRMSKSAAVVAALAEVKSMKGDSTEAQRLAQEALKLNPDYRPAMETLARDHYRNRRLDLALYALKGILDGYGPENPPRDKDNAQARLLRALIYKEQNLRRDAIAEFEKALSLRPDLVEARVQLATYLLEAGNAPAAAPLLEGALRYDRDNVLAHLNLGDAYRLLGKTSEAKEQFAWVLSKDPSVTEVHYNLGLLYLFSEQVPGITRLRATELAIESLETYKAKRPRSQSGGAADDTDELITRAKTKKAVIESEAAAPPPPPPTPTASTTAAPPMTPGAVSPPPAPPPAGGAASPGGSSGSLPPLEGGNP
ncbi:MAG: tetratricopeptide repeat protein [Polyangiaceae bacterium]|nr:tetratricopeptide repeat protein [Polyangiaceae bacterium]